MHALLPDKVNVHEARTGAKINTVNLEDIIFENGTAVNTKFKLEDLYCTLGIGHAGAAADLYLSPSQLWACCSVT
jgi:hypothetical protein